MDINEMIAELKQHAGFSEVYHKTTFECVRTMRIGETEKVKFGAVAAAMFGEPQTVTVEIFDAGPDDVNPNLRYYCRATTGSKMATGNPDASIEGALLNVHWGNLDR
jgi:hypothetical protein